MEWNTATQKLTLHNLRLSEIKLFFFTCVNFVSIHQIFDQCALQNHNIVLYDLTNIISSLDCILEGHLNISILNECPLTQSEQKQLVKASLEELGLNFESRQPIDYLHKVKLRSLLAVALYNFTDDILLNVPYDELLLYGIARLFLKELSEQLINLCEQLLPFI